MFCGNELWSFTGKNKVKLSTLVKCCFSLFGNVSN